MEDKDVITNSSLNSGKITISGSPAIADNQVIRSVGAISLITLSFWCWIWAYKVFLEEHSGLLVFLGIASFIFGIWLPADRHEYLDIENRKIVKEKWYFWHRRNETPLSEFKKIVVRHVCHPGGEGDDTFTGSVGLKPAKGGAVFWVKEFPATSDEMPVEADQFAKELSQVLGLPYLPWGRTS